MNQPSLNKSKEIARFLNGNLQKFALKTVLSAAPSKRGAGAAEEEVWTAMGLLLTGMAWLYNKDGMCLPVRQIRRSELDASYAPVCGNLLNILPFQEENRALEAVLSQIDNPRSRETLKFLIDNQDELEKITRARQELEKKEQRREERRNQSDKERLEEALRKRGKAAKLETEAMEEVIYDPVPNPERRRKKVENDFQKTLDYKLTVPRTSLKYTFREIESPEEKTTLAEWYHGGYCQICQTAIVKWDGTLHFQAVNFLDTSRFQENERATLGLCWNSLCLCPNCAAKYRYGPKDISSFIDQVDAQTVEAGSEEPIPIRIGLQNREVTIRYAPRHFIALKGALNVYRK